MTPSTFDKGLSCCEEFCDYDERWNKTNIGYLKEDVQKAKQEALRKAHEEINGLTNFTGFKIILEKHFGSISSKDSKSPRSNSERME